MAKKKKAPKKPASKGFPGGYVKQGNSKNKTKTFKI